MRKLIRSYWRWHKAIYAANIILVAAAEIAWIFVDKATVWKWLGWPFIVVLVLTLPLLPVGLLTARWEHQEWREDFDRERAEALDQLTEK